MWQPLVEIADEVRETIFVVVVGMFGDRLFAGENGRSPALARRT
jgi:hypothetical protein